MIGQGLTSKINDDLTPRMGGPMETGKAITHQGAPEDINLHGVNAPSRLSTMVTLSARQLASLIPKICALN